MVSPIFIRRMEPGDEPRASALIKRVFTEFVAPHYSDEGVQEFLGFVTPEQLAERRRTGHVAFVADADELLVGVIEIRRSEHITLLFVDGRYQGQGIARGLLAKALEFARRSRPGIAAFTVNSSPNAVPAYRKLGFIQAEPEQTQHGVRYIPMTLEIA